MTSILKAFYNKFDYLKDWRKCHTMSPDLLLLLLTILNPLLRAPHLKLCY